MARWAKTTLMSKVRCPRTTSREAYERALRADNRFSRELVRVYGKEQAGDARYLPDAKMKAKKKGTHKEVEFHVDALDGHPRVYKTFDEAAGFALSLCVSDGRKHNLDVIIYGESGAKWWGGDDGLDQFLEDPDASVHERIVISADAQGRVA